MKNANGDEPTGKGAWTVRDAKVNLAALLNDPRKVRRDHDLFTKTWGEGFKELPSTAIPQSNPRYIAIPNIPRFAFSSYLSETKDKLLRHQSQIVRQRRKELPKQSSRLENDRRSQSQGDRGSRKNLMEVIPKMFLQSNFKLEDERTFTSVLGQPARSVSSSKLLQEKLSHYLDLVEEAIVRRISSRSVAFFDAMKSHDDLNDYLKTMSTAVTKMRSKMASTRCGVSDSTLKIIHLQSKRQNLQCLLQTLQTMISIHQVQPTIQLLLSTNEYAGAFDLIETTQDALTQELAGLHCFRHLGSQLSEIQNVIFHMMKEELSRCIYTDLHRPLSEGVTTVNPIHLMAVVLGLFQRKKLVFLEEFREEVKLEIKTIIKETVLEACDAAESVADDSLEASNENSAEETKTLAERMRNLEFNQWMELLNNVFNNLSLFLRRVQSFLTIVVNVACMSYPLSLKRNLQEVLSDENNSSDENMPALSDGVSKNPSGGFVVGISDDASNDDNALDDMDQYEMRLMESVVESSKIQSADSDDIKGNDSTSKVVEVNTTNQAPAVVLVANDDSDTLLTEEDHDNLMVSLCQTLAWTADFAQDRCVKVIIAKNKNSSLDKLAPAQFLSLTQSIEKYLSATEKTLFQKEASIADADYFVNYFTACLGNAMRGSSVLRGVLQSHASQFITRFHDERKTKLTLILNNETWRQAEVPVELSQMLRNLFLPASKVTSMKNGVDEAANSDAMQSSSQQRVTPEINEEHHTSSALVLDGVEFCVAGTVLLLLKMVSEYVSCSDDLPHVLPDLVSRVAELLTLFNSRTCQLVLGAGALKTAGLKTISTRNLGLASRCLQLVLHLLPSVKRLFEEQFIKYSPSLAMQRKGLKHFDHVAKAYDEHVAEIDSKLINIMDSVVEGSLAQWRIKAPTPSKEFRFICRQMEKFHETISGLLPDVQIHEIMRKMHVRFKKRLQLKLTQCDVHNDGGPQFGLVMSDVTFYQKNLKNLKIFDDKDLGFDSVWR